MEEYRHQCEVRYCLMLKKYGKKFFTDYLSKVLDARGKAAYDQISKDTEIQWAKGNRGDKGDWRG